MNLRAQGIFRFWLRYAVLLALLAAGRFLIGGRVGLAPDLGPVASFPLLLLIYFTGTMLVAVIEAGLDSFRTNLISFVLVRTLSLVPLAFLMILAFRAPPLSDPHLYEGVLIGSVLLGVAFGIIDYNNRAPSEGRAA